MFSHRFLGDALDSKIAYNIKYTSKPTSKNMKENIGS